MIGSLIDTVSRQIETASDGFSETFFEPVIRLGVTGLSRSGKTVFITALVANLIDRGRMHGLGAAQSGRVLTAFLQPQPEDTLPRFEYETHLAAMTGPEPEWPSSTRSISQLRLSMRIQPAGILGNVRGPRTVHLDIVDYPGEWLLDLPLLSQSFGDWSKTALQLARSPARMPYAKDWLEQLDACDPSQPLNEQTAQSVSRAFTGYLFEAREAGFSACAPGRFLMPGDLEGSPALTFCPLPESSTPRRSLAREFSRRFEAYKSKVVTPFFRDHFSRIDRQIVLVDALGAIHSGPQAVLDLRDAMADILACFRIGKNTVLSALFGKTVEKILFAATKADHLHHTQHSALTSIMEALVRDARAKVEFSGAKTHAMSLASLRATVEETLTHDGEPLDCVRGRLLGTGKQAAMYPGELPTDPNALLAPATQGARDWLGSDYEVMQFAPATISLQPGDGPPHIRLDQAAQFLIGDRLV